MLLEIIHHASVPAFLRLSSKKGLWQLTWRWSF